MDFKFLIPMMVGTILRGVMWVFTYAATKLGIETIDDNTGKAIANFIAAGVCALGAIAWSWWKNKKLLATEPPKQ